MAKTYTEEQLNTFDKATLIQLLLMQQSQLQEIDKKLQLLLEQAAVLKNNRFGKKSEKLGIENQVCFMEVDGDIVFFNEAEAVNALVIIDIFFFPFFRYHFIKRRGCQIYMPFID